MLSDVVSLKRWPWSGLPGVFGFMLLPFVALSSGASFILCMYGVILETEWMSRLLKLMMSFKCGPTERLQVLVLAISDTDTKTNIRSCQYMIQKTLLYASVNCCKEAIVKQCLNSSFQMLECNISVKNCSIPYIAM